MAGRLFSERERQAIDCESIMDELAEEYGGAVEYLVRGGFVVWEAYLVTPDGKDEYVGEFCPDSAIWMRAGCRPVLCKGEITDTCWMIARAIAQHKSFHNGVARAEESNEFNGHAGDEGEPER